MPEIQTQAQEITLEEVSAKVDMLGQQLNWIVENLAGLFAFVQQVSSNGGGIRGLMQAMRTAPPQLSALQEDAPHAG